jgi:hypothetical protein
MHAWLVAPAKTPVPSMRLMKVIRSMLSMPENVLTVVPVPGNVHVKPLNLPSNALRIAHHQ